MGDTHFGTLEVEDIAKDVQVIQQDAQVNKASTPVQTTEQVTYKFHVSNSSSFLNSENLFAKINIFYPALFLSIAQNFATNAGTRTCPS